MTKSFFSFINNLQDVRLYAGAQLDYIFAIEKEIGANLPPDYKSAMLKSNGATVYGGYVRLFGIKNEEIMDLCTWNNKDYWKFSWNNRCDRFLCFAENAFGDQYAFDIVELLTGLSKVYFLDCLSMTPTPIFEDFSQFLSEEFNRSALQPYDEIMVEARRRFGDLKANHLVYGVSPLLGGTEAIENVQIMDARAAMICNGDIATQIDAAPEGCKINSVTVFEDESGRTRVKLIWSASAT